MLTEKGRDYFGVLAAMSRWGDRWPAGEAGAPVVFHHGACGHDTEAEVVCAGCRVPGAGCRVPRAASREPLRAEDTSMRMGPGYPERLRQRPDIQRRFGAA
ncbi:winged helix-turn-helix transcriptional regulator [Streptomyces guryensis]|uniref:Winged helix-turn-helix transcriptional regulator n=1 Tax=Streptomyces guryensis TaxID=2886947 RepID=A0A9Q3VNR0_9ACTN|nr:winged helix-turn-helix transcriptional regulator [Streptomyces guryensis]MCD9874894.1 winged helix-turn-helix transcriptional regulator [Streptomyces guryensis]